MVRQPHALQSVLPDISSTHLVHTELLQYYWLVNNFIECPSNWVSLVFFFSRLHGCSLSGSISQKWCTLLMTSYQEVQVSICLIAYHLDHVPEWYLPGFSIAVAVFFVFYMLYFLEVHKGRRISSNSWQEEYQKLCEHMLRLPQ